MKIAIISDIHGNYEALKSVAEDISTSDVDKTVCLGDFVGYGPQPEEVAQWLIEKDIPCVMGNHEQAIIDDAALSKFAKGAKASIEITKILISRDTLEYIKDLPVTYALDNILFVHGAPPDAVNTYFDKLSNDEYRDAFRKMKQQFAFIGHTHEPICFYYNGRICNFKLLKKGLNKINSKIKYIVNAGSVGQPRDGNEKAKYIIFDTDDFTVDLRYVPYDIDKTADLIIQRGLPEYNAERLYLRKI